MKAIYQIQLSQGLDLPELLWSSGKELAGPAGMSSKGIIIYTESDIICLTHYQGKPRIFLGNYDYYLPLNIPSEFIFFTSMQTNL